MSKKLLSLSALAAAALFAGCASSGPKTAYANKEFNVVGIVEHSSASYAPITTNTFAIHSDELVSRKNFSGNRTSLLWGLITIADY